MSLGRHFTADQINEALCVKRYEFTQSMDSSLTPNKELIFGLFIAFLQQYLSAKLVILNLAMVFSYMGRHLGKIIMTIIHLHYCTHWIDEASHLNTLAIGNTMSGLFILFFINS